MTSGVSVPFRAITQRIRLVQVLKRSKIPQRSRDFVVVRNVLGREGYRRVPQFGKNGRDRVVLEMMSQVKRSVVELVKSEHPQDG